MSTSPQLFGGPAFDAARDTERLTKQIDCIRELALDGEWRTVQKLTTQLRKRHPLVGFPENSVQAQLRNLRKEGYSVERRHVKNGLFEYRVLSGSLDSGDVELDFTPERREQLAAISAELLAENQIVPMPGETIGDAVTRRIEEVRL